MVQLLHSCKLYQYAIRNCFTSVYYYRYALQEIFKTSIPLMARAITPIVKLPLHWAYSEIYIKLSICFLRQLLLIAIHHSCDSSLFSCSLTSHSLQLNYGHDSSRTYVLIMP
jgi:hypothetical protein